MYYYDEKAAERIIKFAERHCRHTDDSISAKRGDLFKLENWQKEIFRDVYGTKRKANDRRRYRYVWLEVPKKNGKSPMGSIVSLYMTGYDGYQGAEVFNVAADKDQARIVFEACKTMTELDSHLDAAWIRRRDHLLYSESGGKLKVTSADAPTKHGFRLNAIIFDEFEAQPNAELYETLIGAIASKPEPLVWFILTGGHKNTFPHTFHQYAKQIKDGLVQNDSWYVKIYNSGVQDNEVDIFNDKHWKTANPNYGISVSPEFVKDQKQIAQTKPSEVNRILRLHLNVWTGSEKAWLPGYVWQKGKQKAKSLQDFKGRSGYLGLDMASYKDLASVSLILPPKDDDDIYTWFVWWWCPEDTIKERMKGENVNYEQWIANGLIHTTPGNVIDHRAIIEHIKEIGAMVNIDRIGYDRARSTETIVELTDVGFECFPYSQSFQNMNAAIVGMEALLTEGKVNYLGNEVLLWQADNVVMEENFKSEKRPTKKKSKDKIDGIVSGLIAYGEFLTSLQTPEDMPGIAVI